MRVTPHIVISAVAAVVVVMLVAPSIMRSGLRSTSFNEEPTVAMGERNHRLISDETVLLPVAGDPVAITDINDPFLPPVRGQGRVSGRVPPPPPFDVPEPPPLPMPEK